MFDSLFNPIKLRPYETLKKYEGGGNYAISKYYELPWRWFYRKKLYMARNLLDKGRIYTNILDFGAGPGIFTKELKRHALAVKSVDFRDSLDPRSRFQCIVCASTLEFIEDLPWVVERLYKASDVNGQIIVASPTDSFLSKLYFKLIGDKKTRNTPESIAEVVAKWFKITQHTEWMGLYFAFKAVRR